MLMVLENDAGLGQCELLREVAMPQREVDDAVANLLRKGLVSEENGQVCLTTKGVEQTEALWHIAKEQQDRVFEGFDPQVLENFRRVLMAVIKH